MFEKILIANRGEIALRIIRACKELGVRTVAVYSQADIHSPHVRYADEAICIGPAQSANSYLHIPSIMSAAEIADVEAIHPGYGFLAENTHFAEICQSCNIKFIGPPVESIRLMGDKIQAKSSVKHVSVPTIPGSEGAIKDRNEALQISKKMGYPVIIKAAMGGGGRGMRIAHNDVSLASAFMTAKAEAEAVFDSAEVYIEKYLESPRHVEIQIMADQHGNYVYLGERDCTIQRRYQKLIEESPSTAVSSATRAKMGKAAIRAAKGVSYQNVGTVEFLVDRHENFYFMEMNTRVQVEHPVTEMVTGIDIIKQQIKIAAGEKLPFEQKDIQNKGWAIECRINAEDPERDFMPSPGRITGLFLPGGLGVRVDTHVYHGYEIPPFYDSMIAKVIAHGKDRTEAIQIMARALDELLIEGVKTTTSFLRRILDEPRFRLGHYSTQFVEDFLKQR
ncbi:MAG: acetyl-CoA carboxylase biotin carboxylase subunit [Chlamydiae bacterium]|nr:acetyl-CoA carboxylase biotin carboxylase subunit [Chlamydiota bacterium]MBI3277715.1 acetyl-CoA carboxylase biotin carboxylase subunit [Chlamydiota bacterium]